MLLVFSFHLLVYGYIISITRQRNREAGHTPRKKEESNTECRVPKNSKERKESLPQQSLQRNAGKQQTGKDQRSLQENQIPREHFMQRWAQ